MMPPKIAAVVVALLALAGPVRAQTGYWARFGVNISEPVPTLSCYLVAGLPPLPAATKITLCGGLKKTQDLSHAR